MSTLQPATLLRRFVSIVLALSLAVATCAVMPSASALAAVNLAAGKSYTSSTSASDSYPDTSGAELTDGLYGTSDYTDAKWQGRVDVGSYYQTVDLGQNYGVSQMFISFLQDTAVGIYWPDTASFSYSTDNTNYTSLGSAVPLAPSGSSKKYQITLSAPVTARYIRMTVTDPGGWNFEDELEVWGNALTDTGFLSPSANASGSGGDNNGFQTSPTNAYSDNATFAVDTNSGTNTSASCTDNGKDKHSFYNYGFSLPTETTISGIEVRLDAKVDSTSGSPQMCLQLSWDGGSTWTTAKTTDTLTTSEATYILGGSADTWGRAWTDTEFSDANFRLRVINVASNTGRDFSLDWAAVKVYYSGGGAADCDATSQFTGSFIQPALADSWTSAQWQAELEYMQVACVTQLFLQWTADSKAQTTVYPSSLSGYTQSTTNDIVDLAMAYAEAEEMEVYLGLQVNGDWWTKHATDSTWLSNEADLATELADDLYDNYGAYDSFAGWYLSFEMDNWNFLNQSDWDNMTDFYTTVGDHLHTLSPGKPVIISPFFNPAGGQTAAQWQTMWEYILADSPLDVIALQDGVGAGHATVSQLPTWFSATRDAIDNSAPGVELWNDVETFTLDWQPMPIKDVVADMQAVESYIDHTISFTYNYYISPQQVDPIYHETYAAYVGSGTVETTAPGTPSSLTATAVNSMTINLSWAASTDNIGVAGYKIYRNNELVWKIYDNTNSFTDTQLTPSTNYTYKVAAFDAAGNDSAQSSTASATTSAGNTYSTNLASGKSYTASLAADASYPDTNSVELTNGAYGTFSFSDAAWQARNTSATYNFVIDLGSNQSIKEIVTNWMQDIPSSVFLPNKVVYSVSSDNINFTVVGTVNKPAVSPTAWKQTYRVADLSSVTGRYVKIEVTPTGWSFIDEAEVRQ